MRKPRFFTGMLVGLISTPAAVTVFYLAWQLLGLPFSPFDLFDWLARVMPGALVTFGIDALVSTIGFLGLGPVSEVAKAAEQLLALVIFGLLGAAGGGLVFGIARINGGAWTTPAAVAFGAALAFIATKASWSVHGSLPLAHAGWIVAVFLGWAVALRWAHAQLQPYAGEDASVQRLHRRRFLIRMGSSIAVFTVAGTSVGALLARATDGRSGEASVEQIPWSMTGRFPNAHAPVQPAPGTRPELTPVGRHYRIDINLTPPVLREEDWRLWVNGLVDRPRAFTLEELKAYAAMHQFVTLSCISNDVAGDLIGTQRWTGVSLQRLLGDLRLKGGATHLLIRSVDGFYEVVSLETIERDQRVMLTYAWDGLPLSTEHGFPLRIYIPDLYGMKQPKWIESIEVIDSWMAGYWVRRGWSAEARVKTTSVIDTVAVQSLIDRDGETFVPIGGIAYAGARGISKVQVQIDGGDWLDAQLRIPLSMTSWVIWRFDWPFEEGRHTFAVRCFEADGTMQVMVESPVRPDGATGIHSVGETL